MKKQILCLTIIIIFLLSTSVLGALSAELNVSSSSIKIKSGDEITVTLKIKNITDSASGIQGISTDIVYDTNVFETISSSNITSNFFPMYTDEKLVIGNLEDTGILADTEIAKIKFVAKENISEQTTKINFNNVYICDDNNEQVAIDSKNIEITVEKSSTNEQQPNSVTLSKIEITSNPKKTVYEEGEVFNINGMVVTATYSDNTTKIITGYTYSPSRALVTTDTRNTYII